MTIIGLLARHSGTNDGGPMNVISRFQHFNDDPYSDLASWLPNVPSNVLKVLQKCVQLDYAKRPQNVEETRNLFASKPMVFTQLAPHSENVAFKKAMSENIELKKTIVQLQKELEKSEQIYQFELMDTRKIKMERHSLQQESQKIKIEFQTHIKSSQE